MEASWDSVNIHVLLVDLNAVQVLATLHNSLWIEFSEKDQLGRIVMIL